MNRIVVNGYPLVRETNLSWVIVPQFFMQAVRMSLFSLDLSNDIKNFRVRAAGAGTSFTI